MVGLIPRTNADPNVESSVGANPQSKVTNRRISDDESAGVSCFLSITRRSGIN